MLFYLQSVTYLCTGYAVVQLATSLKVAGSIPVENFEIFSLT